MWNILIGILQPAVPVLVTYLTTSGYVSAGTVSGIGMIAAAIAAAASSAVTTKVTTVNPPASPAAPAPKS